MTFRPLTAPPYPGRLVLDALVAAQLAGAAAPLRHGAHAPRAPAGAHSLTRPRRRSPVRKRLAQHPAAAATLLKQPRRQVPTAGRCRLGGRSYSPRWREGVPRHVGRCRDRHRVGGGMRLLDRYVAVTRRRSHAMPPSHQANVALLCRRRPASPSPTSGGALPCQLPPSGPVSERAQLAAQEPQGPDLSGRWDSPSPVGQPVARAPRHPSGCGSALHLRARPRRGRRLGPRGSVCRPSGIRVDRDGGAQAGSGASRGSHARPAGRCSPTGTASPGANCGRLSGTHARAVRAQRAVIASLGWEIVCKAQGRASCALSADFLGIPLYLSVTDKSV